MKQKKINKGENVSFYLPQDTDDSMVKWINKNNKSRLVVYALEFLHHHVGEDFIVDDVPRKILKQYASNKAIPLESSAVSVPIDVAVSAATAAEEVITGSEPIQHEYTEGQAHDESVSQQEPTGYTSIVTHAEGEQVEKKGKFVADYSDDHYA